MMRPKLGIISGGGNLPARLIENCEREGREYVVVALKGQTAPETVTGKPHRWIRLGAAGETLAYLAENSVAELVLAGSIRKPALADLRPDLWMARFLAGNIYELGDNSLFRRLIDHLELKEGFRVIGIDDLTPELISPLKCITIKSPSASDLEDITVGMEAARNLGKQDRGQGIVVSKGHILAREGQSGTDAMIQTLTRLTADQENRGILVKAIKPGQERRVDLPTIGPDTIDLAAKYGLRGIAVEAGNSIILDRKALIEKADKTGIFVIGVAPPTEGESLNCPLVYLIAGEPSADNLGACLMVSLKKITKNKISFAGIGGPAMTSEGLESLFPMEDLSVMGLLEVIPRIGLLRNRILQTKADVLAKNPEVVIGIDSPDFNFRIGRGLAGRGIPLMHLVAPSVWAWRPGRAKKIAKFLDHLMALFPFEPPYFEKHGLPTTYIGHPVLENFSNSGDGPAFRRHYKIGDDEQILLLLFGSRRSEVTHHLPVFKDTVLRLRETVKNFRVITITVAPTQDLISKTLKNWSNKVIIISDPTQKLNAFAASNVALAASGTVALELAIAMVPSIIAYRMNPLTSWFAKRLVKIRFANLVNLVLEREAIPEFLLDRCRAQLMAPELAKLMKLDTLQRQQRQSYSEVLTRLGKGDAPASERAAKIVLKLINERRKYCPEDQHE